MAKISQRKCVRLSEENIDKFLDCFDTVLTDCDGVLWHGPTSIPGSVEAIQHFSSMGKRTFYVTNNSTKSTAEYVIKCQSMGFPAVADSIISSASVAAQYIKHKLCYNGKVFVIGSTGIKLELEALGIPCTGFGPDVVGNMDYAELSTIDVDKEINCVVVGLDLHFSYLKLARAINYLRKPGCHFIATNDDVTLPTISGFLPGTGSLLAAVETASTRKPEVVCGKPSPLIFEMLSGSNNVDAKKTLMIGDRLETDIKFANNCGLLSLLVLTGVASADDIPDAAVNIADVAIPDFYVESLGKLYKLMNRVK